MARLYLFLLPPGVGKRGTSSPPPSRHCRIMNDFFFFFFFFFAFGGLVEGGGGGHGNLLPTPFSPTPPNPYIFV